MEVEGLRGGDEQDKGPGLIATSPARTINKKM
jgi:hypothetical protein